MLNFLKKNFKDESLEEQKNDIKGYPLEMESLILNGLSCDKVPNAVGEFGKVATNPIPVNGVKGEIKYLNRLRGKSGVGFIFHRIGSVDLVEFNSIDVYEVVSVNGKDWDVLYFDMYHPRRSASIPLGYSFSEFHEMLSKIAIGFGVNTFDENFPFGIPDLMEVKYGSFGKALSDKLRIFLKEQKFERPDKQKQLINNLFN